MFALGAKLSTTLNFPSSLYVFHIQLANILVILNESCDFFDVVVFRNTSFLCNRATVWILLQIFLILQECKNSLYDANHIPKIWASNELDFLTQHLQTLENQDKKSQVIILLHQHPISRLTRDTVAAHEKKTVKRRKKERKRKKIKRQKNIEIKLALRLLVKHMEKKWQIRS